MTDLRARMLAIEALVACFSSEEAGGFEGCGLDDAEWNSADGGGIALSDTTASTFIVTVVGHRIKFHGSIMKGK